DVDVAFAPQPVGLGVRRVDEPGGLGVGRLHHAVLRYQALLFFDALLHGLLVGDVAVFEQPVGFGLGAADAGLVLAFGRGGDANRLLASLADHAFAVLARFAHHPVGLRLGVLQHGIAGVQHVLGVVQFARNRVLDVVDQLQYVTAGHHAAGRHRDAAGFFDDGAQFVQRFKNSIHGRALLASAKLLLL